MDEAPKIDPRYDPAFQRGFSGEVTTGQHPHGVARAPKPVAESAPKRAEPLPPQSVPPAYAIDAEPVADEADEVVVAEEEVGAPTRPLTRNPFLLALTLLGAVLVVAGISWAITGRTTVAASGSLASERDYWWVQAALLGAPVMIGCGVLIIAGVLFVFANAWNRAR